MQFSRRGLPRIGFFLWSLCFQFFVAEQIALLGWPGPYSMTQDFISDLGAARSPLHWVMNGSFVLQGVLIFFGAVLVRRVFPGRAVYSIALSLLRVAGVGVLVVGLVPEDSNTRLHLLGAAANFLGGNLGILLLGVVSEKYWYGRISMLLGSVGLVATAALLFRGELGSEVGMVERLAAYPLPLLLTWTGWLMHAARANYDPIPRA